jgi:hypothetical protein
MQPVTFEYPAFNPAQSLTIRAQMTGDADASPQAQILLFTMDGRSITRNKSKYSKILSTWNFTTITNMEEIRAFFRKAEGEYIKYTHYDGSQWILILIGASYAFTSSSGRANIYTDEGRRDHITHDFSLTVERWASA